MRLEEYLYEIIIDEFINFMKPNFREVTSEDEVLRLVLIGLPYSGV